MILSSGLAPVTALRAAGVKVGLGVDGSSSADSASLWLEARQANLEGAGAVPLARLVREALRMRPDRLVVGECRGEEVRELLTALNTGHDGGAGTVHASGISDVPARLEALGALAGLDDHAVARQVVSAIGAIVHVERRSDGIRRVVGIARPVVVAGRLSVRELA